MDTTLKFTEANLFLMKMDGLCTVQVLLYFFDIKLNFLPCLEIVNSIKPVEQESFLESNSPDALALHAESDLTTHDMYFMILVEVLRNHILTENAHFMNHIE